MPSAPSPPTLPQRSARSFAAALALVITAPASAGDWAAAREAFEAGRFAEAVAELEPIAALNPQHTGTQAFLGIARLYTGDAAGAIAPLELAIDDSDRPDYMLYLAWALILDGQPDLALDRLEAVSRDLPGGRLTWARDQLLAVAAVHSSDSHRATRLLKVAVDPGSSVPEPWIALSILARRRGDHAEAAAALGRASELAPSRDDLAKAASAARVLLSGPRLDERFEAALRQSVAEVESQLEKPIPAQRRSGIVIGIGIVEHPLAGAEPADCAMLEDHRCIPGRLALDFAEGGLSRSAAPPD